MLVEKLAEDAVRNLQSDNSNVQAVFDPAWITILADLITQIVEIIQGCRANSPSEVASICSRPSFVQKILLRQKVRQNLGFRANREYGDKVCEALLKTGRSVTQTEIEQLLSEV